MKQFHLTILGFFLLMGLALDANANRATLPIQGFVIDRDSEDTLDGSHTIIFRVYDSSTGGEALHEEAQSIDIVDGFYSTSITLPGTDEEGGAAIRSSEALFLGVQVNDDEEMQPRLEYHTTPWATTADSADEAARADVATVALSLQGENISSMVGDGLTVEDETIVLDTNRSNTWTGSQTYQSQVMYSQTPSSTASTAATLRINPTSTVADANKKYFAIQDNNSDLFTVDREGDVSVAGGISGITSLTASGTVTFSQMISCGSLTTNGSGVIQCSGSGGNGDITSVSTGGGLTGGGATGDVTVSLDTAYAPTWSSQHIFARDPSDGTSANATVRINPATSAAGEKLLALQDNGTDLLTVAKEGIVTSTGTITSAGGLHNINVTLGNDGDADSVSGLMILPTSSNTGDADALRGIYFYDVTSAQAGVTESAIVIGSNWDNAIHLESPSAQITPTELSYLDGVTSSIQTQINNITTTAADITAVTAGSGLSGGGTSGAVTVDIGAGTGITVNADDIQLNYAATLAADPALTAGQAVFDSTDKGLLFEGTTADTNEGALIATTISADRTWTLPDSDGTLALTTSNISGNAATATALAANGANCVAGNYPLGVDASGVAETCTADDDTPDTDAEVPNDITIASSSQTQAFTFGATNKFLIDATTIANTGTAGIIDLNIGVGDAAVVGIDLSLTQNDGATAGRDAIAQNIILTGNDADGDMFGVKITGAATAVATTGSYEAALIIDNAENTTGSMPDGILITSSGIDAGVTDGLDASAANITNALNAGVNNVLFAETDGSGDTIALTPPATIAGGITLTLPSATGTIALTTSNISGNATTATALAANGANCSAGSYALGVDASGTAEGCTADDDTPDSDSEVPDDITVNGSKTIATTNTNSAAGSGNPFDITSTLGAFDGSDDFTAIDINLTNADHAGASNTVQGIDISNFSQDAEATETAIKIGTGWDVGINMGANTIGFMETGGGADIGSIQAPASFTGSRTLTLPDGTGTLALTTSNVSTSTALAANGANCGAGNYPLGVDASGVSESCTADDDTPDSDAEVPNDITLATTSAASVSNTLTVTAGTLADTAEALNLSATQPAVIAGTQTAVDFQITSAGSSSQQNRAMNIDYLGGYTGSSPTVGFRASNQTAGTGTTFGGASNYGMFSAIFGTTTGHNIGLFADAAQSSGLNIGVVGRAKTNAAGEVNNVGIFGSGSGGSAVNVGGWFTLANALPTWTSAALVADNAAIAAPIFLGRDNGSTVFTIADGGDVTLTGDMAVNGDDITADGLLTVNSASYVRVGDSGTPGSANGDDDLYVEGDLEVDGVLYAPDLSPSGTITMADNQWIGLGAAAGRVEFDDLATDEVNILASYVGIGDQTPDGVLDIEGGTLADGIEALNISATFPAVPSGTSTAIDAQITSAGSAAQAQRGGSFELLAGYTGSATTVALRSQNMALGTGQSLAGAAANYSLTGYSSGASTGYNLGVSGFASGSSTLNLGNMGRAVGASDGSNVGVYGKATTATTANVGGWFSLTDTAPTWTSAALVADNAAIAAPIFLGRDNGATVFTIADGGDVTATGAVSTPTLTLTGTGTINGLDSIDATGESTLEAALDIAGDISGTGLSAVTIGNDKVLEAHLKAVDAGGDEECLTYETTVGDFEWQPCGTTITADLLNFTDFSDTMSLDTSTSIAFDATENLTFDAATADRTTDGTGVLQLNVDMAGITASSGADMSVAQQAQFIDLELVDNNDIDNTALGLVISVTMNTDDAGDDAGGLFIYNNAASTANLHALATIGNVDSNTTVDAGLDMFGSPGGVITTGIDLSDSNIVNSLSLGDNAITGTTLTLTASTSLQGNMPDNAANALDIQEGANNYININTTNASENISFGNATTNPSSTFLGTGRVGIGDGTPDAILDIDSSVTTTDVFGITATSLTSGSGIIVTGPSVGADGTGITDAILKIANVDVGNIGTSWGNGVISSTATINSNVDYTSAANLVLNTTNAPGSTNAAAGIYNKMSDATTHENSLYGQMIDVDMTGANTTLSRTAIGEYIDVSATNANGASTTVKGLYITTTGTQTSGTISQYGIHVGNGTSTTTGTTTKYGLVIDAQTGADTIVPFAVRPPAAEVIVSTAVITADSCGTMKRLSADSSIATNTTDTFTAPSSALAGCCMDVVNTDTVDTITLDANAKFKTVGGVDVPLGPMDAVRVCTDGTTWYQITPLAGNS